MRTQIVGARVTTLVGFVSFVDPKVRAAVRVLQATLQNVTVLVVDSDLRTILAALQQHHHHHH